MKLVLAIIGAFILGAIAALPFVSNDAVAKSSESDSSSAEDICCLDLYANPVGLMPREDCIAKQGDAAPANRCTVENDDDGAVAERSDAAGFEGARDIGDVPVYSSDDPSISMEEEDDQPTSVTSGDDAIAERSERETHNDEKICCLDFYANPVGLMPREDCLAKEGDVAPANRCTTERARDIGDAPAYSSSEPIATEVADDTEYEPPTKYYSYNQFGHKTLKYACADNRCWCGGFKDLAGNYIDGNCSEMETKCESNGSADYDCWEADEDYQLCGVSDFDCFEANEGLNQYAGCKCSWE